MLTKSATKYILAHCIIPKLIFHRKNTNYKMFREMVIKLYYFSLLTFHGWINFIYITIEVMHYTCLYSVIFKDNL